MGTEASRNTKRALSRKFSRIQKRFDNSSLRYQIGWAKFSLSTYGQRRKPSKTPETSRQTTRNPSKNFCTVRKKLLTAIGDSFRWCNKVFALDRWATLTTVFFQIVLVSINYTSKRKTFSCIVHFFLLQKLRRSRKLRVADFSVSCIALICGVSADRYPKPRTHQDLYKLFSRLLNFFTHIESFWPIKGFILIYFDFFWIRKRLPFLVKWISSTHYTFWKKNWKKARRFRYFPTIRKLYPNFVKKLHFRNLSCFLRKETSSNCILCSKLSLKHQKHNCLIIFQKYLDLYVL